MAQQQHHIKHSHKRHARTVVVIDRCMYAIGIIGPIMTTPQLINAYQKHVQGLSLATWGAYTVVSFLWFMYGYLHKEKPIIITNLLYFLMDGGIVLAILLYH